MNEIIAEIFKIYPVKNTYLAYITYINDKNHDNPLDNSVIALTKIGKKDNEKIKTIGPAPAYYSINKIIPITTETNNKSKFIKYDDIVNIVVKKNEDKKSITEVIEKLKETNREKINHIENELDINKVLKKTA